MSISKEKDLHRTFMAEAIEMARLNLSENKGGPFGAVIVKEGRFIARAWH